jgi:hypothetical protein
MWDFRDFRRRAQLGMRCGSPSNNSAPSCRTWPCWRRQVSNTVWVLPPPRALAIQAERCVMVNGCFCRASRNQSCGRGVLQLQAAEQPQKPAWLCRFSSGGSEPLPALPHVLSASARANAQVTFWRLGLIPLQLQGSPPHPPCSLLFHGFQALTIVAATAGLDPDALLLAVAKTAGGVFAGARPRGRTGHTSLTAPTPQQQVELATACCLWCLMFSPVPCILCTCNTHAMPTAQFGALRQLTDQFGLWEWLGQKPRWV